MEEEQVVLAVERRIAHAGHLPSPRLHRGDTDASTEWKDVETPMEPRLGIEDL